jgi:dihydrofolate synthase/folylpolyglutamate synthase
MSRQIANMRDAETALKAYVPLVAQLAGGNTTLDRISALMERLGHPERRLRAIHIAGTSGKTSTAYYMASLLHAAGQTVGLTVSPHVDSVTERLQVNGRLISDEQFCAELALFLEIVDTMADKPSYFELLYAFAIWVFARAKLDYVVIETGMGGLHDASNIVSRADKFCIITDIGFDHTHILGNTLPEITTQKVGIVHKNNQLLMYEQAPEIMRVVIDWTARHQAPLITTTETRERSYLGTGNMPRYQQRNWLLAYRAYRELTQRDGLAKLSAEQLSLTQAVQVPARMDERLVGQKLLVMDGAHNAQKMATFIGSFRQAHPGEKPAVLLALKQDKDSAALGPLLADFAARLIITSFGVSQDLPASPADPRQLAVGFARAGVPNITTYASNREAYQALLAAPEKIGVITGSFYLLSQLRKSERLYTT